MSEEAPSTTAFKLATARQKKDTADEAFRSGDVKAGTCFHVIDVDYELLSLPHKP